MRLRTYTTCASYVLLEWMRALGCCCELFDMCVIASFGLKSSLPAKWRRLWKNQKLEDQICIGPMKIRGHLLTHSVRVLVDIFEFKLDGITNSQFPKKKRRIRLSWDDVEGKWVPKNQSPYCNLCANYDGTLSGRMNMGYILKTSRNFDNVHSMHSYVCSSTSYAYNESNEVHSLFFSKKT